MYRSASSKISCRASNNKPALPVGAYRPTKDISSNSRARRNVNPATNYTDTYLDRARAADLVCSQFSSTKSHSRVLPPVTYHLLLLSFAGIRLLKPIGIFMDSLPPPLESRPFSCPFATIWSLSCRCSNLNTCNMPLPPPHLNLVDRSISRVTLWHILNLIRTSFKPSLRPAKRAPSQPCFSHHTYLCSSFSCSECLLL